MTRFFSNILALIDAADEPDRYFNGAIAAANLFDCHLHVLYRSPDNHPLELIWSLQDLYRPAPIKAMARIVRNILL